MPLGEEGIKIPHRGILTEMLNGHTIIVVWNFEMGSSHKIQIYIDESGDLGLKSSKTSTKHFVIAVVLVIDASTLAEIADIMIRFKQKVGIPLHYELKFHSLSNENRIQILTLLSKLPLKIYAFAIDKKVFTKSRGITRPIDLHQEILSYIFSTLKDQFEKASIMIDKSIDSRIDKLFRAIIKKSADKSRAIKVVFKRSKNQDGLQVADIIAGSVLRNFEKKDGRFFKIIKRKTKLYP